MLVATKSLAVHTLLASLLVAAAIPASASAETLGQTAPAGTTGGGCSACNFAQSTAAAGVPAYRVPAGGGVITEWSLRGSAAASGRARLRLWENDGSGGMFLRGQSAEETVYADGRVQSYNTRITVTSGLYLGLRVDNGANSFPTTHSAVTGNRIAILRGDVAEPGNTFASRLSSGGSADGLLNLAVTLEPDVDHDGYGDQTQDCYTDPMRHGACPAPGGGSAPAGTTGGSADTPSTPGTGGSTGGSTGGGYNPPLNVDPACFKTGSCKKVTKKKAKKCKRGYKRVGKKCKRKR